MYVTSVASSHSAACVSCDVSVYLYYNLLKKKQEKKKRKQRYPDFQRSFQLICLSQITLKPALVRIEGQQTDFVSTADVRNGQRDTGLIVARTL